MSLLPRWIGRDRSEADALREQVTALQAKLGHCKAAVRRWTGVRRGFTAVVAVVCLATGFALGLYYEPLKEGTADLARRAGLGGGIANFEAANAAYQKLDYKTALRRLYPLAERGDARAQSLLGIMHANGQGVPRSDSDAVRWLRLAADQGKAVAQFQLGSMFARGRGVPQDYTEASRWYRLAADQNHAQAQYELGFLYATGDGVEEDFVTAHMWFNLAAVNFPPSDNRNRRVAVTNREIMENKMTRDQVFEAQKLAREWKPK
jgi:TPR repeat protein